MPKRTVKVSASEPLITALNYKRAIKMGEIPQTKSNKKIPPFNMGHKMALRKLFKKHPFLAAACASPSEWVIHRLESPDAVRTAAVPMGLDRYVGNRVLAVKRPPWVRSYFNESKMTLTLCDDQTGTKTIVPFADWDALSVAGAVPDIRFTPEEIAYSGTRKKRIPLVDEETGKLEQRHSFLAVFDPNTFRTKATAHDYLSFMASGMRYKLDVINNQGAGRSGICFIQPNEGLADWGKEEIRKAAALAIRLRKTSDYRKR